MSLPDEKDLPSSHCGSESQERDMSSKERTPIISIGLHVLTTARESLERMLFLYETEATAREQFEASVNVIVETVQVQGKVIVTGMGKSGHIGQKLVATFNSMSIDSCFLHPAEALHGDMGCVGDKDVIIMVTNSGQTPELENLLFHIHSDIPVILISGVPETRMTRSSPRPILALVTFGDDERATFGVPAPTASALAALALGDALAVSSGRALHGANLSMIFRQNHPGGSIGIARTHLPLHQAAKL